MYLKNKTVFLVNQTIFHEISLLPVKIEGETIKVLVTLRLQKNYIVFFFFLRGYLNVVPKNFLLLLI